MSLGNGKNQGVFFSSSGLPGAWKFEVSTQASFTSPLPSFSPSELTAIVLHVCLVSLCTETHRTVPSLSNCVCVPVTKMFFLLASHFWILACWLSVWLPDFSSHVCAWPSYFNYIIYFVFWTWFSCHAPFFLSGPTLTFKGSAFLSRS